MSCRPLIVLADDLTGAAEVAAIAHEAGLKSVVLTKIPRTLPNADCVVLDTDTRLVPTASAARRVRTSAVRLKKSPHRGFFKKTDSVLRGPVLAELAACAAALGLKRAVLVAGNPSLGRIIRDGRYFIAGRPLDETAFARDPHHPARSSEVLGLLGAGKNSPAVYRAATDSWPRTGIIVGQNRSAVETIRWARAVEKDTLPAGAADFFRAWLRTRWNPASGRVGSRPTGKDLSEGQVPPHLEPALLLHGTTSAPAPAGALLFNGLRAPSAAKVALRLRHDRVAVIATSPLTANDPLAPARIAQSFSELAQNLHRAGAFHHLIIVGGATAAAVLRGLGWPALEVVRVWGPGVVSLQPLAAPGFLVTLKPGSYPWPASIRRALPRVFSSHA